MLNRTENLLENEENQRFGDDLDPRVFQILAEGDFASVFHYEVDVLPVREIREEFYDIFMVYRSQKLYLSLEISSQTKQFSLFVDFDCHFLACWNMSTNSDFCVGPFSDELADIVILVFQETLISFEIVVSHIPFFLVSVVVLSRGLVLAHGNWGLLKHPLFHFQPFDILLIKRLRLLELIHLLSLYPSFQLNRKFFLDLRFQIF